jgi:hypothetical protein
MTKIIVTSASKQATTYTNRSFNCSKMLNTRRKNQAAKGTSARGRELQGEQPFMNGPSPRQQEEIRVADEAMSE